MIVFILGFSKSGTTMCARALHKAGIDFGITKDGDYPKQPYEEKTGCELIMKQIGALKKDSLFIPTTYNFDAEEIEKYIKERSNKLKNWGFKFPYMTFIYSSWKAYLPEHKVFALKRSPRSLLTHYSKNKNNLNNEKKERILKVQKRYNNIIDSLNIKVFHFEKILSEGFEELENYIGIKIPDVRNYKGIGDGNKYFKGVNHGRKI